MTVYCNSENQIMQTKAISFVAACMCILIGALLEEATAQGKLNSHKRLALINY